MRARVPVSRLALTLSLSLAAGLAACGGGSSATNDTGYKPPPPPAGSVGRADGVYGGAIHNATTPGVNANLTLVLEDLSYWTLYGNRAAADGSFTSAGFVQGVGQVDAANSRFTSDDARDFSPNSRATAKVSATFVPDQSTQGSITSADRTSYFDGTTTALAPYNYANPAALDAVLGDWRIVKLGGGDGTAQVGADGAFTWTASGCTATGTLTPRASGKNVYDIALTVGPAPCSAPGSNQRGVGIALPLAGGKVQFITVTVDADRKAWTYTSGVR